MNSVSHTQDFLREHLKNLEYGRLNSFIICHWMEKHRESPEPPLFKWKIIDQYPDALRRQLCEGLNILHTGTLNKKCEFNSNIICRLQVPENNFLTDKQLKNEVDSRKSFKEKLRCFINEKRGVGSVIKPVSNKMLVKDPKRDLSCRLSPINKRKREGQEMDTSTPTNTRREV